MVIRDIIIDDTGKVTCSGKDDAGEWSIEGQIDQSSKDEEGCYNVEIVKDYARWKVYYSGKINHERTKMKGHYGFKPSFEKNEDARWKLEREVLEDIGSNWEGYYTQYDQKHVMAIAGLDIERGVVKGSGEDDAGSWTISGTVDKDDRDKKGRVLIKFVKDYTEWQIFYRGRMNASMTTMSGHWGFKAEDFDEVE